MIRDKDPRVFQSLMDIDFYKFTMGQLIFHHYPDIPVKYAFKNRTKGVALAKRIREVDLRRELDYVMMLGFDNSDLHYLRGTNEYSDRMFKEDYLEFLRKLRLPPYRLEWGDDEFVIEFSGKWSESIYWETIALAVVNELYYKSLMDNLNDFERDVVYATGKIRLAEKIKMLKENSVVNLMPKENSGVTFSDFGTRRRFSKTWHDYVIKVLAEELPRNQFIGTSNVALAEKYGLMPIGTSAHELFMIMAGVMAENDEGISVSVSKVLDDWWDEYGWGLSIALPDTFGTDSFLKVFGGERAHVWKGTRQDSGDPYDYGDNKIIPFYESVGIDSRGKLIIFSDGLNIEEMIKIQRHFANRIKTTFGWGTNLTNDLGFKALSIVVKPVEANGRGLVKLSDNIAKAIGKPEDIERYKRIFGYSTDFNKACVY